MCFCVYYFELQIVSKVWPEIPSSSLTNLLTQVRSQPFSQILIYKLTTDYNI